MNPIGSILVKDGGSRLEHCLHFARRDETTVDNSFPSLYSEHGSL